MTLPYSPSKAIFNGNSVATDFPFTFKVWNTTQLDVTISDPDGVASTAVGWTATLQSNGGGTVTYRHEGKPLPVGWTLAIVRNMKFSQEVDLINNTMFHAEVVEDQLDYATAERQQLKEAVDRSIKVPPTNPNPPELLADMLFEARDETLAAAAAAAISETAAEASATAAAASEAAAALILETAVAVIGEEKANALDSIESKHNAALDDIANSRSDSLGAISSLATERLTAITREGQLQQNAVAAAGAGIVASGQDVINRVVAEGTVQEGRVTATGNKARVDLVLEGDAQVNRVATVGAEYVKQTHEEALLAKGEADRAEAAADKAVSIAEVDIASATNIGLCPKVGEGLKVVTLPDGSKRMDAITQVIAVSTPELTFPADVAVGFEYTLSMASGTLIPGGRVTGYEVTVDGGTAIDIVANSEGLGAAVISPAGVDLTTGNIAVLAIDSEGNRSKIAYKTFTKHAVAVRAPHVLSPLEGDTDVALLAQFQVQSFGIYGMAAVGVATQLQIATDRDFAHVVYDSGENHAYATTFAMTDRLPDDCTLYARARHKAEIYGWSAYGSVVSFTTIAKGIAKPRIIAPIAGAVDQPINVAVVLSPIEVSGISATPANTRVIVARDEALTERIFDSGESAAYSTSVATNNLPVNTLLHVSGQHKDGELGWSELADISSFTTLNAYTVTPTITSPTAAVDVELRPTFTFSPFANIGPVDTLKQRIFQVARDALFSDLIVNVTLTGANVGQYAMQADLPLFSDLYARVQDEGNTWGVSEWSTVYSFKTLNAYVEKPTITFPTQGATGVGIRPTFTATAFANVGPTDTPAGGHWRLARDAAFTDIVEEANGNYTTSFTPSQDLDITRDYWVDVLYRGGLWGASQRADAVKFTTLTAFIHAPDVTGITEGQTGVSLVPTVNIGAFAVTPAGFDAPKAADNFWYEFRSNATVVASGYKTLPASGGIVSPSTPLPLDSNVTFTGKWVGSKLTGASKSVGFKTLQYTVPIGQTWLIRDSGTWVNPVPGGTYAIYAMGGGGGGAVAKTASGYRYLIAGAGGGSGYATYQQKPISGNANITVGQGGGGAADNYQGQTGTPTTLQEIGISVVGGQGGALTNDNDGLRGGAGGNGGGGGSSANNQSHTINGNNANGSLGGGLIYFDDWGAFGTDYGGGGGNGAGIIAGLPAPQGGLGGVPSLISGGYIIPGGQGGSGYGGGGGGGGSTKSGGKGDPMVIGGLGGNGLTIEGFYLGGKGGNGGAYDSLFGSTTPPAAGEKGGVLIKLVAYPA